MCQKKADYLLREIAAFFRISPSAIVKVGPQMKKIQASKKTLENALEAIE